MASKSRFALLVVLTRKAMLYAQLFKRLLRGLGAPCFHVFIALPDAFDGFPIIGPFPFEIRGQSLIQRVSYILSMPLGIVVQLRLAFRFDGYYIHDAFRVVVAAAPVNAQVRLGPSEAASKKY